MSQMSSPPPQLKHMFACALQDCRAVMAGVHNFSCAPARQFDAVFVRFRWAKLVAHGACAFGHTTNFDCARQLAPSSMARAAPHMDLLFGMRVAETATCARCFLVRGSRCAFEYVTLARSSSW